MSSVLPAYRATGQAISIRLKMLLTFYCKGNPWGYIGKIKKQTGLNRPRISAWMNNSVKSISLDTLRKIVGFLVSEFGANPSELLGTMFGLEPSRFWGLLSSDTSQKFKTQICQGVRTDKKTDEARWINLNDSHLLGTFIYELSSSHKRGELKLEPHSLRSWIDEEHREEILNDAKKFYHTQEKTGNRALVCIGSMKSLSLSECVIAKIFNTKPFVTQSNIKRPMDLRIPIFFKYREDDPHPPSAFGGEKIPLKAAASRAGIAYEVDSKHWDFCPISETQDAGVVFYINRPPDDTVEMVLAGFTGRATGCLAYVLTDLADKLWPPTYVRSDLKVGAFIIRYEFPQPDADNNPSHSMFSLPKKIEVIPLSKEVLVRRLGSARRQPSSPDDSNEKNQKGKRPKPR